MSFAEEIVEAEFGSCENLDGKNGEEFLFCSQSQDNFSIVSFESEKNWNRIRHNSWASDCTNLTLTSLEMDFCRICLDGDKNDLISPCNCMGTLALIHQSCLEQWLSISGTDRCEICRWYYPVFKIPPVYRDFLWHPDNAYCRRNLVADIVCLIFLTPILLISVFLCFFGGAKYFYEYPAQSSGLLIISSLLTAVYVLWCRCTFRYHFSTWREWKLKHQQVKLIITS